MAVTAKGAEAVFKRLGVGRPTIKTAAELRLKTFPPLKFIVPGLIVEGLVILAGKPKVRKSWMALDIALAVAAGRFCLGDRKCQQGDVLYLALEDGDRRLQRRITKLLPTFGGEWPEPFNYATQWPRADQDGVEKIEEWCHDHPDARLVVIDVHARFRAPINARTNAYAEDYSSLARLQELAIKRAITILVIHHTRKGESEDPVEEISGTLGLSGSADAFLVLKRTGAGITLSGRGRDSEDVNLAVQFNDATCRWTIIGEASEIRRSSERNSVLEALESSGTDGLSPADLSNELGISSANARQLLHRMAKDGEIQKVKYGHYSHKAVTLVTPSHKPNKASKTNPIANGGDSVTAATAPVETAVPVTLPAEDYLGPPGDNPADLDIPTFLRR